MGQYRLQLLAKHGDLETIEWVDVIVPPSVPEGWQAGLAHYEVYKEIAGAAVSDLTSSPKFPDAPDEVRTVSSLQGVVTGNNYGSRLSGYLVAPKTGDFLFYIASDDSSSLHLNAKPSQGNEADDKAGLTLVASVENSWTSEEEWKKIPGQQSQPVALVEGELYYFEALHKEGWGGDHLSVGWLVPGRTDIEVIDTTSIAISIQPSLSPVIVQQPVSQEVALGENVTFTLGTEGPKLASYQWRLDGKPILGASLDPVLTLENIGAGHQGVYDCIYTAGDKVLTSVPVALKISGLGAVKSGGLWQELWEGMPGSTVIDLTADSRFPRWSF